MADDEKEESPDDEADDQERSEEEGAEKGDEAEVSELKARVAELESLLAELESPASPAARWAGWILGTLVGATSLVLIVVLIGGGWPRPCDCEEAPSPTPAAAEQQRQQVDLERLLQQHSGDFQECFESWASGHSDELHPGWAVIVRLEISADGGGQVQQVEASGENLPEALSSCLEGRVQLWRFPGPGPYTIELPFAIEGDPHRPARDAGEAAEGGPTDAGAEGGATDAGAEGGPTGAADAG